MRSSIWINFGDVWNGESEKLVVQLSIRSSNATNDEYLFLVAMWMRRPTSRPPTSVLF